MCKLAHNFKVPVLLITKDRVSSANESFSSLLLFKNYKNLFTGFKEDKKKYNLIGQKFIQNRLKGFTVEQLFWITNSIHKDNSNIKFNKIKIKNNLIKKQINAVVFLHDFYDNPHLMGV